MKFKQSIKAQVALEFLTTYGWAFLVILILIGTLAYFGILTPSKILPNRCNFGAEFQCLDYQIIQTGAAPNPQVKLKLKNNIGEPIDATAFTLTKDDGTAVAGCIAPLAQMGWGSSVVKDLAWTACTAATTGWVAGEKGKVLITISYNKAVSGNTYVRQVKGEIFSTVS